MQPNPKRLLTPILVLTGLLTLPTIGQAQFQVAPQSAGFAPASQTQVVARPANVGRAGDFGFMPGPIGPGFNPFGWGMMDPFGGFLQGAASVIDAQGQFMISNQQAVGMKEQNKQAKVDTRKKTFDQWLYERANTPTLEQMREEAQAEQLRRSRNDPPLTEIWSGKALNDILKSAQRMESQAGVRGPSVPIDPEILKHINVTTGKTTAGIGVLKDGGKLRLAAAFFDARFDKERKEIDQLLPQAVTQTQMDALDPALLASINKNLSTLRSKLRSASADMESTDYIQALQYYNQVADSMKVLAQPGAANVVNNKFQPKGNTIGDIVDQMARQGMFFAPAAPGEEQFYTALHRSMLAYDSSLIRLVSQ